MRKRWRVLLRWTLVAVLLAAVVGALVWAQSTAHAQEEVVPEGERVGEIVLGPEANTVLHSPEELAAVLRAGGVDPDEVARILEMERRLQQAHDAGLPLDAVREKAREWFEEIFRAPMQGPEDPSSSLPSPLAWYTHYAGIYATCRVPRVRATWAMPGYRHFYAWFRSWLGNYYVAYGYCPYASCVLAHVASGEYAWDYHAVSMVNTWPYWHTARCDG